MDTFKKWPKTQRLETLTFSATEKIDGTNVHILVEDNQVVGVGSRNRWITPGKTTDNYGFAEWVDLHKDALVRLGPGYHYGEWYGRGIGRGYGLQERRWALFQPGRYPDLAERQLPSNVEVVPTLGIRTGWDLEAQLQSWRALLQVQGSLAVPGYMQPEGLMLRVAGQTLKWVFDKAGPSPEESHGID